MQQRNFAIITNDQQSSLAIAKKLTELLLAINMAPNQIEPEIIFTIGGDGTFLKAIRIFNSRLDQVHFITINAGNLGFNASYQRTQLPELLADIKNNNLHSQAVDALELIINDHKYYSLNEIKLLNIFKTITFSLLINDELLQKCQSSGVVISSNTGTTGFMKSLHGAIIFSKHHLMQVLEIAPVNNIKHHSLNVPLIFDNTQQITVTGNINNANLVVDGYNYELTNNTFQVSVIPNKIKLLTSINQQVSKLQQIKKSFIKNYFEE